ncbi:hypothetical protein P152DRAFT_419921 [Eremomyces bilateralis CBS 781.70]|uniref:Small ribosomal subunit protein mS23 n=1 Tax=Eremomyces bilateralis CBS 781.70 TaxID=1392243 RepID=A0A6G1FZC1_9PEZI|nr:uncharacterized protein P152DRAFT_419921 [Eremomyces bilateralis CBS 781.70]KAF1811143.1 hypothetical protein P152DRAFT_419921 [Eremomyces bilateralis CBS 781.70]
MGRIDHRPLSVLPTAHSLFTSGRAKSLPPWFAIASAFPPSQALVRPQKRSGKKSKMFMPLPIAYREDKMREEFFGDHPWELARPRVVLEGDGRNEGWDWSTGVVQAGRPTDGESVIQRWLYLHRGPPKLPKYQAYDIARKEFYRVRHDEDIERRVAHEEALHTGAYFGLGPLEVGEILEDTAYTGWKYWAEQQIARLDRAVQNSYSAVPDEVEGEGVEGEGSVAEEGEGKEKAM